MPNRALAVAVAAVALLGTAAANAAAADRYLAPTTPGAGAGCLDEAAPCDNLDTALDASIAGDVIHFAAGAYDAANMGSRNIDVAGVTLAGPRAGEPAPGRTGPEAVLPAGSPGLSVTAAGVTVDGLSFAAGSVFAVRMLRGTTLRNTIVEGASTGVVVSNLGAGTTTVEGNAISSSGVAVTATGVVNVADNLLVSTSSQAISVTGSAAVPTITSNDVRAIEGIVVQNLGAMAEIHGNRFDTEDEGIYSLAALPIDAEDNWWGCNDGPGAAGCAVAAQFGTGAIDADPWLVLDAEGPAEVIQGRDAPVTAWVSTNSDGVETGLDPWPGAAVGFHATAGFATVSPATASLATGIAEATFRTTMPTAPLEPTTWNATLDAQTVTRTIDVYRDVDADPPLLYANPWWTGIPWVRTITLTNVGDGPVDVTSATYTGSPAWTISRDECTGETLAAGGACEVDATFAATGEGYHGGEVVFVTTGGDLYVPVAGRAFAPPVATPTPRVLDFAHQVVGTTSDAQTVTVENTGPRTLEIDRLSGKDAGASLFKVSNDACTGASLDEGESCTFDVRFAPAAVGSWQARIEIVSNVAKKAVRVRGSGVKPLAVGPSSFDFGTVPRRTSSGAQYFVVTNRSSSALPVTLSKSGAGRTLFALDPGSCDDGPLAPGAICAFAVTFTPQAVGSWSPAIDVTGGGRTTTVPITGQGVT